MIRIEILSGPESGRVFELDSGTHSVGRASNNDIVLPVDSVSGRHLNLEVSGDTVRFSDLGSTNGTWSGGLQVKDGEWFAGSELKLGSLRLRLVSDEATASTGGLEDPDAADDAAIHRRAREAAMSGKRKGGLMTALAALFIVGGGAGWWFFLRDDGSSASAGGERVNSGTTAAATATDLLEGFGAFGDEGAWSLDRGVTLQEGRLSSAQEKGGVARLVRRFPAPMSALRFEANLGSGLKVTPLLRWGASEEDGTPSYLWQAPEISTGSSLLSLPQDAVWFELSLRLQGRGDLQELLALEEDSDASKIQMGLFQGESHGANLLLKSSEGVLLTARGSAGSWSVDGTSLRFTPAGTSNLAIRPGAALLASGPALVLAQGGPLGITNGMSLADSPGLLLGGQASRFLMRFPQPSAVRVQDGAAIFSASEALLLQGSFKEDLTEAARLSQRISRAQRERNDRELLEATDELLRDYPFDEDKIQEALLAARGSLEGGRARLQDLQERASAVLFAGSVQAMHALADESAALAASLPGTEIAPEASGLQVVLQSAADALDEEQSAAREAYRARLEGALAGPYPALAAWLQKEVQ
jgi:hypothetical protein